MFRWPSLEEIKPASLREICTFIYWEFDPDVAIQWALAVLSLAAIAMIATTGTMHRWGFVVGLASQPFWILASHRGRTAGGARTWGMIVLSWCYLMVWIVGIGERFPNLF